MFHRGTPFLLVLIVFTADAFAQARSTLTEGSLSSKTGLAIDKAAPAGLSKEQIPIGSKVYVAPLNGYESYIIAAFVKKQTPITVVNSPEKADYSITGVSESVQAGWAKMLILGSQQSNEQASIVMTNLKTGTAVWGYNVNKSNSYKGKQSSSEACAKHLKARIEGRE
jgi:hypothetical protein